MRDFSFGDRLSSLRQECGYSQFQLATLIGVSDKAVSKWETGAAKPRMKTCQRLASVLGVDIGDLFSENGHTSSWGGYGMNKKKLWEAAEDRLYLLMEKNPIFLLSTASRQRRTSYGTLTLLYYLLQSPAFDM